VSSTQNNRADLLIQEVKKDAAERLFLLSQQVGLNTWTLEHFSSELDKQGGLALVLSKSQQDCAYLIASSLVGDVELLQMGVLATFRRQGLARILMHKFLHYCHALKAERIFLEVRSSNAAAIALYLQFGFSQDGVRKGYYSNPVEDALLMSKKVYALQEIS
jgi:ribosomal-protein-alanine acetyltransferase